MGVLEKKESELYSPSITPILHHSSNPDWIMSWSVIISQSSFGIIDQSSQFET